MTVQTEISRSGPYAGAGTTGPFTVGFRFLANAHLQVIRTSVSGVDTTLVLTTDYSVTGAGGVSGTVTLAAALAVGEKLNIIRDVPFTQLADYVENDAFPAESHENALDLLTMQTQQNREVLDRALTLPATASGVSTELPAPESNKIIGWNASATAMQNIDVGTLAIVVAYGTSAGDLFSGNGVQTAFILSANPGALYNLDVSIGGVDQRAGVDYFWSSGNTLTFDVAPVSGTNNIQAKYKQALPQGFTDSSASTYTPPGTGSVQTTAQSKLRERISAKDFGVVGDGVTNDTATLSAAINYANQLSVGVGKPANLDLNPGTYLVTPGGLPPILCSIDGPRARIVAATNANANLITIGYPDGISFANFQTIRLMSLTGYGFAYSFTGTRYGKGIGFTAAAGQFIPQLKVDIGFIEGFKEGINGNCTSGFHIGTSIFNIQTLWYCTIGIVGISGALQYENNIFNISYAVACNFTVFFSSVGVEHCTQNRVHIACLELHTIVGQSGFNLSGANCNQNIIEVDSIYYNANTAWIVYTDLLTWGNEYRLPGVDTAKLTFGNDILKTGLGALNDGSMNSASRSVVYGNSSPPASLPKRAGDRYIVNNPSGYGPASYVYNGTSWGLETSAGNSPKTSLALTVTAGAGTITSATSLMTYSIYNGVCTFDLVISIPTNGTGTVSVRVTMPAPATNIAMVHGRAASISAKALQGLIAVGGVLSIYNYDGTYPGSNGETLYVSGSYFVV